jgi:hypothetical protein
LPPWAPGYHCVLTLVFSVFGDSENVAYNLSAVSGVVSILIVFLISFLIFKSPGPELWTAFLFGFIPIHLKYSGASDMSVVSVFFVLSAVFSWLIYARSINVKSLSLAVTVLLNKTFSHAHYEEYRLILANKNSIPVKDYWWYEKMDNSEKTYEALAGFYDFTPISRCRESGGETYSFELLTKKK